MSNEIFSELSDDYMWSMRNAPQGPSPDYDEQLATIEKKRRRKSTGSPVAEQSKPSAT